MSYNKETGQYKRKGIQLRIDQWKEVEEAYNTFHPLVNKTDYDGNYIPDVYEARVPLIEFIATVFSDMNYGVQHCKKHREMGVRDVRYCCPLCFPNRSNIQEASGSMTEVVKEVNNNAEKK